MNIDKLYRLTTPQRDILLTEHNRTSPIDRRLWSDRGRMMRDQHRLLQRVLSAQIRWRQQPAPASDRIIR